MPSYEENMLKLLQKAKENPFVPIGMAGFFAIVGYRLVTLKSRKDAKLSLYLVKTRVIAQGFAVGAITLGVLFSMCRDYILKPGEQSKAARPK